MVDSIKQINDDKAPPKQQKVDRKGGSNIYLLPNLITTAVLFFGFYALVATLNNDFSAAAIAILIAAVLDAIDGRVARFTQSATAFGAEYDSLADMVAFGVVPAILVFRWGLSSLGNIGWMCAFVYTACAALRLARFNSRQGDDPKIFIGLATPAAAIAVAAGIWVLSEMVMTEPVTRLWIMGVAAAMVGLGVLMISNIHYWSLKQVSLIGKIPFFSLVAVVMAFALVAVDPPKVLLLFAVAYALFDPMRALFKLMARLRLNPGQPAKFFVMKEKPPAKQSNQGK